MRKSRSDFSHVGKAVFLGDPPADDTETTNTLSFLTQRAQRLFYVIVATICAAAHSSNITCTWPLNVLKFLDFGLSCFRGP